MERILKFFRLLGDATGLFLLLGGLMFATNNTRMAPARRRRLDVKKSAQALNARRAGAAI